MKKAELLKLLEEISNEAEIVVAGYSDEIMGEYTFNSNLTISKTEAYVSKKGSIQMTISNYVREEDKLIEVWELQ